jgi:hypothetical protein
MNQTSIPNIPTNKAMEQTNIRRRRNSARLAFADHWIAS